MARITWNSSSIPEIVHVLPVSGVDAAANNEGFAIADAAYTVNGQRPVYRFCDGVTSGALTIGSIKCSYSDAEKSDPGEPTDPSKPADAPKPGDSTEEPTSPSEKPTGPSKNVTKPTEKQTNAPKTGDHSILWIWAVLAVLSVGTCFAVILVCPCKRH